MRSIDTRCMLMNILLLEKRISFGIWRVSKLYALKFRIYFMSNMFVLKTSIFEAQTGVVNVFCRTTRSRPSFSMYCSFCNNYFLSVLHYLCSNFCCCVVVVVFQFLLLKLVSFLTHQFLDTKHQIFHMSDSFLLISFFLSSLTFLHAFSASTLTLAKCTIYFEVSALSQCSGSSTFGQQVSFFLLVDFSVFVIS